jgi:hypothetical protein
MTRPGVNFKGLSLCIVLLVLTGCTSVPPFELKDHVPIVAKAGPPFEAIVVHVQCAVWRSAAAAFQNESLRTKIVNNNYIAAASISADVVESNSINPSLNFIRPFSSTMSNLTLSVGGQYGSTNHRVFTYAFPIRLVRKNGLISTNDPDIKKFCENDSPQGRGIAGDLGLDEIMLGGISSVNGTWSPVTIESGSQKNWIFGTTIDFTISEGLNGGPSWTVKNFKGPGGGNSGLLNANRVAKDTLLISFLPSSPPKVSLNVLGLEVEDQQPVEKSNGAGQDFNTKMILQNLLSTLGQ